jgi:hypothetical protein
VACIPVKNRSRLDPSAPVLPTRRDTLPHRLYRCRRVIVLVTALSRIRRLMARLSFNDQGIVNARRGRRRNTGLGRRG